MIVDEKDGSESASDSEVIVPVHNDHYNGHEIFKINCCIFRCPMLKRMITLAQVKWQGYILYNFAVNIFWNS